MKLDNHIAYRFLTDDTLAWEMVDSTYPNLYTTDDEEIKARAADLYHNVNFKDQKAYYITHTLIDKLEMLKVQRNTTSLVRDNEKLDPIGEIKQYDWRVFNNVSNRKITFILPDNFVIRLVIRGDILWFCHAGYTDVDVKTNRAYLGWAMFYCNSKTNSICTHWLHHDVKAVDDFVYRLMCFFFLSENAEEIVQAGARYGTRKSGKLINSLPIPVTIVTSKWNVTSIRTEGFDVSGHFRLQPTKTGTKMIFIDPFRKHGYVRKAKSETEK